ncbi:MAG TPA: FlgD immunoglobulin-like domain containing protein [Candidatus Ratteibacteria bacterium]|mgnify:FL=1|nr:FlgD immunoglobulin-like domain containing protein [Candidatus Ratteibacteria bacterium]
MRKIINVFAIGLLFMGFVFAEVKDFSYGNGQINYILTQASDVIIQLFTSKEKLVGTIFAGNQKEGKYTYFWKGKDTDGNPVQKGNYILRIKTGRKLIKDTKFAGEGFLKFGNPSDVEIDKNGDIYVFDRGIQEKDKPNKIRVYKFHSDGKDAPDFKPIELEDENQNYFNARGGGPWMAVSDDKIFYGGRHCVNVHDTKGKYLYLIGGWRPQPIDPDDKTREGKRGIYGGGAGGALGKENRIYVRNVEGAEIKVFDRTKPGGDGWLFTSNKDMVYAPVSGFYVGPSMASDSKSKIYMTGQDLRRYDDTGNEIVFRYKYNESLREPIGLALDNENMVYVAERGIIPKDETNPLPSRVSVVWDSGESLSLVKYFEFSDIKGLRDVAISPDGKSLYLLEDMDNFGYLGDKLQWPSRNIQGEGRLFKYDFSYSQILEKKINLNGQDLDK